MRTLWITSEYHPRVGGLERYVADFLDGLSSHCEVGLITGDSQSLLPGQNVTHVGALNLSKPESVDEFEDNCASIARMVDDYKPDVIHFASGGVACYYRALPRSIPLFASAHCKDVTRPWQLTPGRDVHDEIAAGLRACENVYCVSHYTKFWVDDLVPGAKTSVMNPGFSMPELPAGFAARSFLPRATAPMLLTVARIIPRKGHLNTLRALEKVNHPFEWHIVGTGSHYSALADEIASSSIRDRVILHGLVSDEKLQDLYASCDAFILVPNALIDAGGVDAEGFGLVYLEAALFGKPSIGSKVGGCADAILSESTGILVDPDNIDEIAVNIDRLLASRSLCESLGRQADCRARSDFQWPSRISQLYADYSVAVKGVRV